MLFDVRYCDGSIGIFLSVFVLYSNSYLCSDFFLYLDLFLFILICYEEKSDGVRCEIWRWINWRNIKQPPLFPTLSIKPCYIQLHLCKNAIFEQTKQILFAFWRRRNTNNVRIFHISFHVSTNVEKNFWNWTPQNWPKENIATKLISGVHRAPQQEKSIFRRCPETHQKNVNYANILKSGFWRDAGCGRRRSLLSGENKKLQSMFHLLQCRL